MKKTINQQAALLLRNMDLQTAIHEHSEEIDAEYLSEAQQAAIKAVAAYKRRQDEIAYMFPLSELVYDFMGQHMFPDELTDYRRLSVKLLTAMTDPEINKRMQDKVGEGFTGEFVVLLNRLITFVENLKASAIEPLLVIQDIVNHVKPEETLNEIKEEYEERLQVSLAGKYKYA